MSLFTIGDTHLSFGTDKPMDVFGGWSGYEKRLEKNWRAVVTDSDTVVLAGDISWAMKLSEAAGDFAFLNSLPGQKIILKGNHDYWWETKSKMDTFFAQQGFDTLSILYNNAYKAGGFAVAGTRGWFFDAESEHDKKVLNREVMRLKASISAAKQLGGETVVFLHYPPVSHKQRCNEIMDILIEEEISRCYYGHLHGSAAAQGFNGSCEGIEFRLISCDYLEFCPKLVINAAEK